MVDKNQIEYPKMKKKMIINWVVVLLTPLKTG